MSAYIIGFYVLLISTVGAAVRWGGRTERTVAASYAIATFASLALRSPGAASWRHVEFGILLVDAALLCALVWLASKDGFPWLLGSAALQLISSLAHLGKALDADLWRLGYAIMAGLSSYPTLLLLALGIWQRQHHRKPSRSLAGC